jgi:hypothetical protein
MWKLFAALKEGRANITEQQRALDRKNAAPFPLGSFSERLLTICLNCSAKNTCYSSSVNPNKSVSSAHQIVLSGTNSAV